MALFSVGLPLYFNINIERFLYRHIRELAPPPGGHVFLDIMNFRNLQEGHLNTFYAKYNSNLASGFREDL